ncbi:endonuclease V [Fulvivirgaceae bacterium PWU4]|uniref:Endonuclease V n=1 Tax=Chryseosolibacter histidini TaxID=2782349 RepID=A0AAP2DK19_9BACT|nr:endonuclease V [Chryseosolibacter histidini]MBT1696949.1 endonuclease V [Chryseosolibacter histidini]
MILAFDTYYSDKKAKTVAIGFNAWTDAQPHEVFTETLDDVADYQPGEFYKRELPCILSLLSRIDLTEVEAIIIDGFVILDDHGKPGLGGHLYGRLDQKIPVIGVAKTNFALINEGKREVFRGESERPLFVTALGIDLDVASNYIRHMHGDYRIPTLLKHLDGLTKK